MEHRARAGGGRLRVALVGAGLVGQAAHAITLADDRARFELVAVVDPSETVRNGVAARYGVAHTTATLAEAAALGLDAVAALQDAARAAEALRRRVRRDRDVT